MRVVFGTSIMPLGGGSLEIKLASARTSSSVALRMTSFMISITRNFRET
jgi:hypothetical protein